MPVKFLQKKLNILPILLGGLLLLVLAMLAKHWYTRYKTEKPYLIGIILNPAELPAGQLAILKEIVGHKLQAINQQGGINGRQLNVFYLDDENNEKKTYELVRRSSQDTSVIAYVGCRGIMRSKILGPLLTQKQIPFIGLYVFTQLFQQYPTMYTSSVGTQEVQKYFTVLLKSKGKRIGLIAEKDTRLTELMQEIVERSVRENPDQAITLRQFYLKGYHFDIVKDKQLAEAIRKDTDFLVCLSDAETSNSLFTFLHKENLHIPMYNGGSTDFMLIDQTTPGFKAAELFYINPFSIPSAQNTRFLEQIQQYQKSTTIVPEAIAQVSIAGRIADEIGLLHEASQVRTLLKSKSTRAKINAGLKKYINGKRIYRGWLADWYFTPEHAYAGETMLAWKPRNQVIPVLAPQQYLRTDSGLRQRPVLYTNLNLEEISQVNDDEGTFNASFYLEINSEQQLNIKDLDFANAVRNEINHEALIEARLIRSRKDTQRFRFYNYLYKVSGQFFFEPDLRQYPLDRQKFPITLQANDPEQVFLVQPTQKELRDTVFEATGWIYKGQYMGYEQDIISTANNFYRQQKNIPYYKFSYVYLMKRAPIDFFLKTLVPLLSIIIICYFSVYIPPREFEALAGIQVTGLLSSIALYFSAYKPEMQYATISDKIFIFMYLMITSLIGTSILIYVSHHKNAPVTRLMRIYQRYFYPVIVLAFTIYIRWF
jgi:ABC-type branched-subunit amino acid transport system substrate-binding protein